MKDVLSVVTFVMGALCFVAFLSTVGPDTAPRKPLHCKMTASRAPGCRSAAE